MQIDRTRALAVLLAASFDATVGCGPAAPPYQQVDEIEQALSGTNAIKVVSDGLCVDVQGASTSDGGSVIQWGCDTGTNQQWKLNQVATDVYTIVSVNSGKCIDVSGASTTPGAPVIQWACNGLNNQKWQAVSNGSGQVELHSVNSGLCLDVTGGSTTAGAKFEQWTCNGQPNQRFTFTQLSGAGVCGSTGAPPAHYNHVVIFSFENRTWSNVGLGFSASTMPYLHSLASQCSFFSDWTETNTSQSSLTQYIGETSGVNNANTVNDCSPSTSCRSTDNNIFRQVRVAGGTARSYVEGATAGCSASGNAVRHIPALYYFGTYTDGTGTHNDHDFCNTEVRPYSEFDVNNLPTYAFVTPNLCNDGHDCGDATVNAWASTNIQRVLDSAAYKAGTVAVFVWYDEDHPVPNLQIAPTSHKGDITQVGVGTHAALLKTIEDMLGVSSMNQGQLPNATDLRSLLGI